MALRVLLADESVTIKKVIQLALQDFAVEVKAVPVGTDVLEVSLSFQPDLIFADVLLQKRSGYEVCRDLKANAKTAAIPVVLMFSAFMEIDQNQLDDCGADGRLEKPFEVESLRNLVLKLVPRTRSQRLATFLEFPKLNDTQSGIAQKPVSSDTAFDRTPAIPLGPPPVSVPPQSLKPLSPPPIESGPARGQARENAKPGANFASSEQARAVAELGALPDLGLEEDPAQSPGVNTKSGWDMDSFDPIDSAATDDSDKFDSFESVRLDPVQAAKPQASESLSDFSGSFRFDDLSTDKEPAQFSAPTEKPGPSSSALSADQPNPFEVRSASAQQGAPRSPHGTGSHSSFASSANSDSQSSSSFSNQASAFSAASGSGDDDAFDAWSSQPLDAVSSPKPMAPQSPHTPSQSSDRTAPLFPEERAATEDDFSFQSLNAMRAPQESAQDEAISVFSLPDPALEFGRSGLQTEAALGIESQDSGSQLEIEPLTMDAIAQPEIVREVLKDPIFTRTGLGDLEIDLEKTQPSAPANNKSARPPAAGTFNPSEPYDRKLLRENALKARASDPSWQSAQSAPAIDPQIELAVERIVQRLLPEIAERVIRRELDRLLEDTRL